MEGRIIVKTKTISVGSFWQEIQIPDGIYQGLWSGFEVRMFFNDHTVKFNTSGGVKGINIPVTVTITNGEAEVINEH